jgi:hypothetical protein
MLACAGNATAGRDPRLPACDCGQFAVTLRAARADPTARCASAYTPHGPHRARIGTCRSQSGAPLEVIDERWDVTPYEPIAGARTCPAGGSWHMVWAKAGDQANKAKAASGRSVAVTAEAVALESSSALAFGVRDDQPIL